MKKLGTCTNTYVGVTNRPSKLAYPGGASANYLYFSNSGDKRLQQIKNLNNSTNTSKQLISQQDYTYDAEGEIKTWTKNYAGLAAPQRFDLGYDNADQLTTAPLKNASTNALIKQYTYGYDTASNRTSELVGTATTNSTPNNVNEITSQSGAKNRTLSYDVNGNMTSDGGTRTFEWDGANRLVAINYTGLTTRSEFTYDGLSRVAKIFEKTGATINSRRKFVWVGTEMVEFRDASDAVTQRNYRQGQYVGTTAYFYTRDHLGSIREMFTGGGTVVARYDYDPYGRSTTVLGTTPTDFNFTGLYRHAKSGLDLATYRAYDPDLGRWINKDPIAERGGLNLYAYVANHPLSGTDALGLEADTIEVIKSDGEFDGSNFLSHLIKHDIANKLLHLRSIDDGVAVHVTFRNVCPSDHPILVSSEAVPASVGSATKIGDNSVRVDVHTSLVVRAIGEYAVGGEIDLDRLTSHTQLRAKCKRKCSI